MKVLVELFDDCQLENVAASLKYKPEKIIFVGYKKMMTRKRISDLEKFFCMCKIDVKIEFEIVGRYDFEAIVSLLCSIAEQNEDCCFDLTGGRELVLAAMGAAAQTHNVPMIQVDLKSGDVIFLKNCGNMKDPGRVRMTIEEGVALNGGAVVEGGPGGCKWNIDDEFEKDVELMWNICRKNCGLWNRQMSVLTELEKFDCGDGELCLEGDANAAKRAGYDVFINKELLGQLVSAGLITFEERSGGFVKIRFKNNQVKKCLTKAGNILEVYSVIAAMKIKQENDEFYDDIDSGVYIDWDGVVHDTDEKEKDTRNEIDIVMMRQFTPIFISCKNGEARKEALYELNTVAEKLGGEHAKKVLLATYISTDKESKRHFLQRARDMKINVIDGIDNMTREEFGEKLKEI